MSARSGAGAGEGVPEARRSGQAFTGRFDASTERILPSRLVTHVHLLRHGAVQGLEQRIVRGQLDEPLSDAGRAESAALARWLAANEHRPDAIVSSDLVRCRELAALVGEACGRPFALDARLREQSMGRWEGHTWAEITAAEPETVRAYWDDYVHARPGGGESLQELALRVATAWDELLARHAGRRVVVVTHIGVIRVLLCRLLGVPMEEALRFAPATASHTALQLGEAGAVLNALGERPWSFHAARAEDGPRPRAAQGAGGARAPAVDATAALARGADATDAGATRAEATRAEATGADATGAEATRAEATGADATGADATGADARCAAGRSPAPRAARPLRIALSGSAGTGKTTLGRRLAEELGLPFLEERMRRRLELGFDLHALTPAGWRELMASDWDAQRAEEDACAEGFVSDRSSLDFAAFWLHYGLHDDRAATERWMARMFAEARRYDRIVLCPWGGPPIVDDGVRSTNRWAQLRFQATLEGLLERFFDPARVLRVSAGAELEPRVESVLAAL